jgi:hypothetical protein
VGSRTSLGYGRGFKVYTLSSHPIVLLSVTAGGADEWDGTPAIGSVLEPGVSYHDFEEVYHFGISTEGTAYYAILGANGEVIGEFDATMRIQSISENQVACTTRVGTCQPGGSFQDGATLTLLDPHRARSTTSRLRRARLRRPH